MRAKSVNEYNEFERGIDPKTSLGIGVYPKNPIPKFMSGVEDIQERPTSIRFSDFNKMVGSMRVDFILISLREALSKEFGYPVRVEPDDYGGGTIWMDLPENFSIEFLSSEAKGTWYPLLRGPNGKGIEKMTGSTVFSAMAPKIRKLLKKNNIDIGQ